MDEELHDTMTSTSTIVKSNFPCSQRTRRGFNFLMLMCPRSMESARYLGSAINYNLGLYMEVVLDHPTRPGLVDPTSRTVTLMPNRRPLITSHKDLAFLLHRPSLNAVGGQCAFQGWNFSDIPTPALAPERSSDGTCELSPTLLTILGLVGAQGGAGAAEGRHCQGAGGAS
jgi:hypothetical protein